MMTSSAMVPVKNVVETSEESKIEVATKFGETSERNKDDATSGNNENESKQFEDNPGDLPEDATKGDNAIVDTQTETTEHSVYENEVVSRKSLDDNQGREEGADDTQSVEKKQKGDTSNSGGKQDLDEGLGEDKIRAEKGDSSCGGPIRASE